MWPDCATRAAHHIVQEVFYNFSNIIKKLCSLPLYKISTVQLKQNVSLKIIVYRDVWNFYVETPYFLRLRCFLMA